MNLREGKGREIEERGKVVVVREGRRREGEVVRGAREKEI